MIKKIIKLFLVLLIVISSIVVFSSSSVNAATKKQFKFTYKNKTYYAVVSTKNCSVVNYYKKDSKGELKKLTGTTLTNVKKSSEGKDAKKQAQKWCKEKKDEEDAASKNAGSGTGTDSGNTSGGGGSTTDSGGGESGDSGGSGSSSEPGVVDAGPSDICKTPNIPKSVKISTGCDEKDIEGSSDGSEGSNNDLTDSIASILRNIILASGSIAIVFIVIGGIQYMTSSGDVNKTKKARDTILYACIGLIICTLAFAIVNFTIDLMKDNDDDSDNKEAKESLIITNNDIAFSKEKL